MDGRAEKEEWKKGRDVVSLVKVVAVACIFIRPHTHTERRCQYDHSALAFKRCLLMSEVSGSPARLIITVYCWGLG